VTWSRGCSAKRLFVTLKRAMLLFGRAEFVQGDTGAVKGGSGACIRQTSGCRCMPLRTCCASLKRIKRKVNRSRAPSGALFSGRAGCFRLGRCGLVILGLYHLLHIELRFRGNRLTTTDVTAVGVVPNGLRRNSPSFPESGPMEDLHVVSGCGFHNSEYQKYDSTRRANQ
jgi:hypothetical protein